MTTISAFQPVDCSGDATAETKVKEVVMEAEPITKPITEEKVGKENLSTVDAVQQNTRSPFLRDD